MSPFKSKAQQKYLWATHPKLAKKWSDKYGVSKDLPKKVKKPATKRRKKTRKEK